jgi:nucleotide-binding universal stress UspA family protein
MSVRPVLACVDGSAVSMLAVEWAAREAALRRAELCLMHVWERAAEEDPLPAAQRWVQESFPGLEIRTQARDGTIAEVLLECSKQARLLVAGSRGVGRPAEALPNSTEAVLAMHSRCPVVIVPDEPVPDDGPVVVGVDGTPLSEAAVDFAFDAAAVRNTGLVAVHAWTGAIPPADRAGTRAAEGQREDRLLAEALAGWQQKYPDVDTTRLTVQDRPVRVLLEQAEAAQLLVVGSRGQGGFTGMLLGSTSTALLYCTPCPLAVVRQR